MATQQKQGAVQEKTTGVEGLLMEGTMPNEKATAMAKDIFDDLWGLGITPIPTSSVIV